MKPSNITSLGLFSSKNVALATRKNGKMLLIDAKGKNASREYPWIKELSGGSYCFSNGKLIGYLDMTGKEAVAPEFVYAEPMKNGGTIGVWPHPNGRTKKKQQITYKIDYVFMNEDFVVSDVVNNQEWVITEEKEKDVLQNGGSHRFHHQIDPLTRNAFVYNESALYIKGKKVGPVVKAPTGPDYSQRYVICTTRTRFLYAIQRNSANSPTGLTWYNWVYTDASGKALDFDIGK